MNISFGALSDNSFYFTYNRAGILVIATELVKRDGKKISSLSLMYICNFNVNCSKSNLSRVI